MQNTDQLILFARAPIYGRVKQRLARDIGKSKALDFYSDTLTSTIARLQCGPWNLSVSIATPGDEHHRVFNGITTTVQTAGDLGARMRCSLDSHNNCKRIIIGSDIPDIQPRHVEYAFALLSSHDLVFGPATDGGFWLVGCGADQEQTDQTFMHNVRWSGPHALADTLKSVPAGKSVATACTLSDVDDKTAYQDYLHRSDVRPLAGVK